MNCLLYINSRDTARLSCDNQMNYQLYVDLRVYILTQKKKCLVNGHWERKIGCAFIDIKGK